MNDQNETTQLRYLEETATRLRQNGFTVEPIEDHHLPVCWEKGRLSRVSGKGSVLYRQAVIDTAKMTSEYIAILETAPRLKASGLDGGCRILADFGGRMFRPLQRRLRDERNRKSFAAHRLGKASQDGLGISIDRKAAAEWFQKSAEAGNPCSAYALGKLLLEKEQIPQAIHFQSGWS